MAGAYWGGPVSDTAKGDGMITHDDYFPDAGADKNTRARIMFDMIWRGHRSARSHEYKRGIADALRRFVDGDCIPCYLTPGSVEFDAWESGWREGMAWARSINEGAEQ